MSSAPSKIAKTYGGAGDSVAEEFHRCPLCNDPFPIGELESHAAECSLPPNEETPPNQSDTTGPEVQDPEDTAPEEDL